ncbi:MAG: LysR family transcriptional regulator [Lachnospiraceae bacterium]|nr:LysR family transcriptional regulator [Lachnospiraceae bacterium]
MDSNKYEAFLLAVDHGSLTAAAEYLGYTQSGITRIIKNLEEELGFPLFVRNKKGVTLTENGKTMVPIFREISRALQNVQQISADIRGTVRGNISIGSYNSIAASWIPQILKGFQSLYPGVSISLHEGGNLAMEKALNEKSVDCCFCARLANAACDWIPLCEDEVVAWLPADHPMAKKKAFPISELAKAPFIHTTPGQDTEIDRLLKKLNITPDVRFTTMNAFTTYNMVAAGLGISMDQRLRSHKWNGAVKELSFEPKQFEELGIAVPALSEASPATKKFIKYVRTINISELDG